MLIHSNKARRMALLKTLNRSEVDSICELVLNGVAGPAKEHIPPELIEKCRRRKHCVRTLAFNHRLSWKKRRDILTNQTGSGWFIPLLASVVSSLFLK